MNIIALDLGGTKLSAAIFNEDGKINHKALAALEKRQGKDVSALLRQQIRELLSIAESEKLEINAIGISVPGIYYSKTGHVWAPNIPGWTDYPLLPELGSIPATKNIKIKIDSDRACYILGETWQGIAKGCKDAIFLAVGTGIGAGILINGNVLRGYGDIAGAIGWMALDRPFRSEYKTCGCFEYHASGEGIAKSAQKFLKNAHDYSGILNKKNIEQITSHDIFESYKKQDPLATKVLQECIVYWGMAVANLISLFNPEKIIFGGGVFGPAAQFLDQIKKEAQLWAQPISIQQVILEISALGGDAGLFGAGRLAFLSLNETN